MGKRGRPRIPLITEDIGDLEGKLPPRPIVLDQVIYWLDIGGTMEEIAGSFRVSTRTLERRIKELTGMNIVELKEKTCGSAKLKLRNNQIKLSETNATMAIWLGKQWIGQKDPDKSDAIIISHDAASLAMKEILDKTKNPLNNGAGT